MDILIVVYRKRRRRLIVSGVLVQGRCKGPWRVHHRLTVSEFLVEGLSDGILHEHAATCVLI